MKALGNICVGILCVYAHRYRVLIGWVGMSEEIGLLHAIHLVETKF